MLDVLERVKVWLCKEIYLSVQASACSMSSLPSIYSCHSMCAVPGGGAERGGAVRGASPAAA